MTAESDSPGFSEHPLSYGQKALMYVQKLVPESPVYNVAFGMRILSELNVGALRETFRILTERHASLRTTYAPRDRDYVQVVHRRRETAFRIHEASDLGEDEFQAELDGEARRAFDLERGPLMRVVLFLRRAGEHVLFVAFHHMAVDLWSLTVLMDEFRAIYPAVKAGETAVLPRIEKDYTDFVQWQGKMLAGPEGERHWNYWKETLSGQIEPLNLATDFPRPSLQGFEGGDFPFVIRAEVAGRMNALAAAMRTTPYVVLLAAFQGLLHRYTGAVDFLVSSPAMGRTRTEFESVVGFFANPVVLRAKLSGNPAFEEMVAAAAGTAIGAVEHQDFPFPLILERMGADLHSGRNPISDVMFLYHAPHRFISERREQETLSSLGIYSPGRTGSRVDFGGLIAEFHNPSLPVTQSSVDMEFTDVGSDLCGMIHYRKDLFRPETISRFANHYQEFLAAAAANPRARLADIPFPGEPERGRLLAWLGTENKTALDGMFHDLFRRQAAGAPDAPALLHKNRRTTYRELDAFANAVAARLASLGTAPDSRVCVCLERSPGMIASVLGILKAGCAFVPMDTSYPKDRLEFMASDSAPVAVVTERRFASLFRSVTAPTLLIESDFPETAAGGEHAARRPGPSPADLAAVVYTSGSTGKPKGVMIEHRALFNLVSAFNAAYSTGPGDRVMQQTPVAFDASFEEIFPVLAAGGMLCLPAVEDLESVESRVRFIREYEITIFGAVPSLLRCFNDLAAEMPSVRLVLTGGEALLERQVDDLITRVPIANEYGPTETTVYCLSYVTSPGRPGTDPFGRVPIGRPIPNARACVLDRAMKPVPSGAIGELYVGGAGLARGYLNRPDLTAEKFVADPFDPAPGARLYRTGDLVRLLPDGNAVFVGRADSQVKVRGIRVELEEVETALCKHPRVSAACVAPAGGEQVTDRLVALVVPAPGSEPTPEALREFLSSRLPAALIPSVFVFVESLPLTPAGKLDRKRVRVPHTAASAAPGGEYVPPRTPAEKKIAALWSELFATEQIGIHDNFFAMGGHSLQAMQLSVMISRDFGVELPLRALLEAPTVAELAARLDSGSAAAPAPGPVPARAPVPVTLAPGGSRAPLFFIHPPGGGIHMFRRLARRLDCGRPIHALQSGALGRAEEEFENLPEAAREYAKAIAAGQAASPPIVASWCGGGAYAWSAVKALEDAGGKVARLVLLDCFLPADVAGLRPDPASAVQLAQNLFFLFGAADNLKDRVSASDVKPGDVKALFDLLKSLPEGQRAVYSEPFLDELFKRFPMLPRELVKNQMQLVARHDAWSRQFQPAPLSCDLTMIWAADSVKMGTSDWGRHCRGKIEELRVPGDHFSMLLPPRVYGTAKKLRTALESLA